MLRHVEKVYLLNINSFHLFISKPETILRKKYTKILCEASLQRCIVTSYIYDYYFTLVTLHEDMMGVMNRQEDPVPKSLIQEIKTKYNGEEILICI